MIPMSLSSGHLGAQASETGAARAGSLLAVRPWQMNPTSIRELLLRLGLCAGIGAAMPSCKGDSGTPNQGTGGGGGVGGGVGGLAGTGGTGGGSAGATDGSADGDTDGRP
jgi:hypothetical protein